MKPIVITIRANAAATASALANPSDATRVARSLAALSVSLAGKSRPGKRAASAREIVGIVQAPFVAGRRCVGSGLGCIYIPLYEVISRQCILNTRNGQFYHPAGM